MINAEIGLDCLIQGERGSGNVSEKGEENVIKFDVSVNTKA